MKSWRTITTLLLFALLGATRASADVSIDGHLELIGPTEHAYIAIPVDVPEGSELSTIRIALSEGSTITRVLIAEDQDGRPLPDTWLTIAEGVEGPTGEWVDLAIPVGATPAGADTWILLESTPAGQPTPGTDRGVGYTTAPAPRPALCGDGSTAWGKVAAVTLALEATFRETAAFKAQSARTPKPAPTPAQGDTVPHAPVFLGVQPNPTSGLSNFAFHQVASGVATVDIFDLKGRKVRTVGGGFLPPGRHELTWDGRSTNGARVARGTYLARIRLPGLSTTVRVSILP